MQTQSAADYRHTKPQYRRISTNVNQSANQRRMTAETTDPIRSCCCTPNPDWITNEKATDYRQTFRRSITRTTISNSRTITQNGTANNQVSATIAKLAAATDQVIIIHESVWHFIELKNVKRTKRQKTDNYDKISSCKRTQTDRLHPLIHNCR